MGSYKNRGANAEKAMLETGVEYKEKSDNIRQSEGETQRGQQYARTQTCNSASHFRHLLYLAQQGWERGGGGQRTRAILCKALYTK